VIFNNRLRFDRIMVTSLWPRFGPPCIQEIEASMDMDISMDIHIIYVDMDAQFHIYCKPVSIHYYIK